jgi:hypothetical protein
MDEKQFREIQLKMDTIIKLLATTTLKEFDTNKDKIIFLNNLGFEPKNIIAITDIPAQTVYNELTKLKKQEKIPKTTSETAKQEE